MTQTLLAGESIELDRVRVEFGRVVAVEEAHLSIGAGEFFSFLGPSGCGKTTLLRLISGFMEPSAGSVRIGGRDMRGIGPNARPTVLIFQNLALFPFMSVAENIAFGLEMRGVGRVARRKRAEELLDLIALPEAADKKVSELSGGQRQRVAIARALAVEPKVLLLDEPLSALDLKLRQHMRAELRALQKRTGVTFVYITHDQGEALTMSDRVAVMSRGRVQQIADPLTLYDDPANAFVATFIGENNAFDGVIEAAGGGFATVATKAGVLHGACRNGLVAGERAVLFIRPERLRLHATEAVANRIAGVVTASSFEGSYAHVFATLDGGGTLMLQIPNGGSESPLAGLSPGARLDAAFDPADALVLAAGERAREH